MENELADILERASLIRQEAARPDAGVPESVLKLLDHIILELSSPEPVLPNIIANSRGMMLWYFDQGFKDVPIHSKIADLCADLERSRRD